MVPVPERATLIGEPDALLATVRVPVSFAALLGSKFTVYVSDCPGVKTTLVEEPLRLNPVPATATLEMLAFVFPVFFTITCFEFADPTDALPKLTLVGLAISCTAAVSPVPVRSIGIEESVALLFTVIAPDTLLAAVGLNAAVKLALAPGANVIGTDSPETLTVETEGASAETVTVAVPEFARRIVWLDSVPTTTFPKVIDDGVAVSADEGVVVAVPLRSTTKDESDALLAIETLPERAPAAVGL